MKNVLLMGLVVSFFTIFTTSSVLALTLSPARLEIIAEPGTAKVNEIELYNEQNSDQVYYVHVKKFQAKGGPGTPAWAFSKDGFVSWTKIVNKISIKKGEKIKIPFSVIVPPKTRGGNYLGGIYLSTTTSYTVKERGNIGALVFLRVNYSSSTCLTTTNVLSKGSKNEDVLKLQQFLVDGGYLTSKPNGYFGDGTVKAVKTFQSTNYLTQDGFVATTTRNKINNEMKCRINNSK